jgi:hypothetical protein
MIYTALCIMFWMRAYLEFFGPQMALAYWLDAISQGPKTREFQGPTLVMDMHPSKTLCTGLY